MSWDRYAVCSSCFLVNGLDVKMIKTWKHYRLVIKGKQVSKKALIFPRWDSEMTV